jgi:hypothetical protein
MCFHANQWICMRKLRGILCNYFEFILINPLFDLGIKM